MKFYIYMNEVSLIYLWLIFFFIFYFLFIYLFLRTHLWFVLAGWSD